MSSLRLIQAIYSDVLLIVVVRQIYDHYATTDMTRWREWIWDKQVSINGGRLGNMCTNLLVMFVSSTVRGSTDSQYFLSY